MTIGELYSSGLLTTNEYGTMDIFRPFTVSGKIYPTNQEIAEQAVEAAILSMCNQAQGKAIYDMVPAAVEIATGKAAERAAQAGPGAYNALVEVFSSIFSRNKTPTRLYHTTNASVEDIYLSGRIVPKVEGSVFAADTLYTGSEGALSTGLLKQGKSTIIFQGEAAEMLRPHPVEGPFSLMKRLGGQYKAGFGDLELVESELINSNTLLVKEMKLVEPFQEPFIGQSRLWGRRLLDLSIVPVGTYLGVELAKELSSGKK